MDSFLRASTATGDGKPSLGSLKFCLFLGPISAEFPVILRLPVFLASEDAGLLNSREKAYDEAQIVKASDLKVTLQYRCWI